MLKHFKIKLIRKIRDMSSLSDESDSSLNHKTAASIFRLALRDPDVELLLRPVENKRIIKLEGRGMYLILNKTMLEISNHDFSYHLEIPYEKFIRLSKLFDIKLDALIEKEEGNISAQVCTGLNKILEKLKLEE